MGVRNFSRLWTNCFPNVKIRAYKGVSSSCADCSILSAIRKEASTMEVKSKCLVFKFYKPSGLLYLLLSKVREECTKLHALHRSAYMGLRVQYYQRRREALEFPTSVMSIISDGMDQNHCKLPCTGNRKGSEQLTQHLQGSIVHGRWTSIFRSFTTVLKSKNLVIHCVLLELEAFYVAEKRYIKIMTIC